MGFYIELRLLLHILNSKFFIKSSSQSTRWLWHQQEREGGFQGSSHIRLSAPLLAYVNTKTEVAIHGQEACKWGVVALLNKQQVIGLCGVIGVIGVIRLLLNLFNQLIYVLVVSREHTALFGWEGAIELVNLNADGGQIDGYATIGAIWPQSCHRSKLKNFSLYCADGAEGEKVRKVQQISRQPTL